ncbi:MAG: cytochrome b/b6 domain-containing protein [bacterium]
MFQQRRHPDFFSLKTFFALLLLSIVVVATASTQSKEDCIACHNDKSLSMEKKGKQVPLYVDGSILSSSAHKKLVCVACHTGFDAGNVPHKEKIEPIKCTLCHKDAALKHAFHSEMIKSAEAGEGKGVSCKNCHGTHDVSSSKSANASKGGKGLTETCGKCHASVKETFMSSQHAKALAQNIPGAPSCITCHQNNVTKTTATLDSTQLKIAQEKLCLSCHLDDPAVRARISPSAGFIASYQASVHGMALNGGNVKAANCIDCHGSHEMRTGTDPKSLVNKMHIPQVCAKCHAKISAAYNASVHGKALLNGSNESPVCTNCHGEHNILKHTDPHSPVSAQNVSSQVCSPCHSSVRLSEKYGLASDRFKSFEDSFHGLAGKAGSLVVANCASCHGVHDIKPSGDPESKIHKTNLIATCGKCHPGANENFTKGAVHVIVTEKQEDLLYFISTAYVILIIMVVGGMLLHNLMDFVKKSKRQLMYRRGLLEHKHVSHRLYLRMSFSERIQHASLLVSFITLVLTGFALRYPNAWWVAPFNDIIPSAFEWRGVLHRIAAVVLVAASVYHIYYVLFIPRGKELIRDLLPRIQDGKDALAVLKYNLGFSREKPRFDRFSYIEKSEYWALVWGTVVMGVTGVILWFDNTFLGLLTKLWWDVARTIHYYEAWLATLSIIVWHFYFVIFNPDSYPLNLAFWKGTLTEEEMEEEHPLELEKIRREEFIKEIQEGFETKQQQNDQH